MLHEGSIAKIWRQLRISQFVDWPGPLIVMYHGLGGSDGLPPNDFAAQCTRLMELYDVVPLRSAVEALGTPDAKRMASITFDDGYHDFSEIGVPILERLGLHATLFVPAGKVGGYNDWDEGQRPRRFILDQEGLASLDPTVVEVGAHGWTHCRLSGLEPDELERETLRARQKLEETVGTPINLFAYPYGQLDDFDALAAKSVEAAGFHAACSTHFGRGSYLAERFRLRRVGIESHDCLETFEAKIRGDFDWQAPKEKIGAWVRARRA